MIIPIILSGGSGTRLWPSSSFQRPKQFLPLTSKYSLLQETVSRLSNLDVACNSPIIVCNETHKASIEKQLMQIKSEAETLICEPEGRNTAPAVAAAALLVAERYSDENPYLLVLPADQMVRGKRQFSEAVAIAISAAKTESLVTLGVQPDKPETGYGYIKRGALEGNYYVVDEFIEKPDIKRAVSFLESGEYYWNSGIFLFSAETYLTELEKFSPEIFKNINESFDKAKIYPNEVRLHEEAFLSCPSDSIDYAVMEHTDKAVVVPLDAGWSDVGSGASLYEESKHDKNGNSISGDIYTLDCHDSYLRADTRPLAGIGLKDLIVVDSTDGLLVASRLQDQEVSKAAAYFSDARKLKTSLLSMFEVSSEHRLYSLTIKTGDSINLESYNVISEDCYFLVVIEGEAQLDFNQESKIIATGETFQIGPDVTVDIIANISAKDLILLFIVKK
ncbi:MAG: mannose-1-phosphate guanylyltransferase/mannose-6-phosphate isomerase [Rhodospirillaceae bacterium]|nr:mannose-1-phosphate guanylyltransferase/mannose-6-phosphate isomerase [Rhodospirillaceae bacterium]